MTLLKLLISRLLFYGSSVHVVEEVEYTYVNCLREPVDFKRCYSTSTTTSGSGNNDGN